MVSINRNMGVAGYFNVIVRDGETLEVKRETGFFKNLITNVGMDRIAGGNAQVLTSFLGAGIAVGTGNNAPLETDTVLQTWRASTTTMFGTATTPYSGVAPYWSGTRVTYRFGVGAASGNISEVGVLAAPTTTSTTQLVSRALIKDISGNPTTITVLPTEVLDVVYECRIYPPTTDTVTTLTILDQEYTFTVRAANAASGNYGAPVGYVSQGTNTGFARQYTPNLYTGTIGTITGSPSGTLNQPNVNTVPQTYSTGTFKRAHTYSLTTAQGNISIGAIFIQAGSLNMPMFQVGISPPFAKDSTKTLSLTFEFSWSRV